MLWFWAIDIVLSELKGNQGLDYKIETIFLNFKENVWRTLNKVELKQR